MEKTTTVLTEAVDLEPQRVAKKQKFLAERRVEPRRYPPSFWDKLSKIRLSRAALRDFDRREVQVIGQLTCILVPKAAYSTGRVGQRLKEFTHRGGPDPAHL